MKWCSKAIQIRTVFVADSFLQFREGDGFRAFLVVEGDHHFTGVLINHRREYLGGKVRPVNETDWFRHENVYPVIIEKAIWQKVQTRLKQQARPAVNNRIKHRYAGLLTCQECGNVFSQIGRASCRERV